MPSDGSFGIIDQPEYSIVSTSYISDTESDDSQDSAVLIPDLVDEVENTIEIMHQKWSQTDPIDSVGMLSQGVISLKEVLSYSTEVR